MKIKNRNTLILLLLTAFVFTACSKENRNPRLIVHVQNVNKTALEGAAVHVWPTDRGVGYTPNSNSDKRHVTNASGDATFDYDLSYVLDVDVEYYVSHLDTSANLIIDTLRGSESVKIDVIKQKEEENLYNQIITVQ